MRQQNLETQRTLGTRVENAEKKPLTVKDAKKSRKGRKEEQTGTKMGNRPYLWELKKNRVWGWLRVVLFPHLRQEHE
jgi:hypothetical protein